MDFVGGAGLAVGLALASFVAGFFGFWGAACAAWIADRRRR